MKRVNLLTKYSISFFALLLILLIIFSKIIDISNEALLVSTIAGVLIYLFSAVFIHKEVNSPLKKIFNLSGKLKLKEDLDEFKDKHVFENFNRIDHFLFV